MLRRHWIVVFALFAAGILAATAPEASAAPPWAGLVNFKKVDADPTKTYTLTQDNGPWMILAITFSGDDAMQEAQALALELRKEFKLEAYTHEKVFDYSETVYGRGFDKYGEPKRMRHSRDERIREVAVLVGNFDAVDDPELARTLEKVKQIEPMSLASKTADQADEYLEENSLADFLLVRRKAVSDKHNKGPMALAFVSANPLLPESYFRPGGVDKFVAGLNEGIKHSLLTNKGTYTIKVATFNGQTIVDPRDISAIEQGRQMSSRLEEAALDAHRMCEALRAKGYDAYEFHTRDDSIVTVGSFDSLGVQQLDGSFQYDPQVLEIVRKFAAKPVFKAPLGTQTNGDRLPQSILGLPFDVEPAPIDVPRRSFASDYVR